MTKGQQKAQSKKSTFDSSAGSASQPILNNYAPNHYNASRRLSFGKKVFIGVGTTALAGVLGLFYVGKRLKEWFFPPSFKKYLATGAIIFSLYAARNCNEVKHGFVDVYNVAKNAFVMNNERRKEIAPYKKEIDILSKDNKQLRKNIAEKDSILNRKTENKTDLAAAVNGELNESDNLENKLSANDETNFPAVREKTDGSISSHGNGLPVSVKSIENMIKKYGGGYTHLIYVNKLDQTLVVYDLDNGVASDYKAYKCTTGKNTAPKSKEGDFATPEGVYLIDNAKMGLKDNPLLGYGFLRVNYPNPQDKQRNRTGSGIGISGTSMDDRVDAILRSKTSTNGCVTILNSDLEDLYSHICSSISKTLVVFENPKRPLVFEGVGINER